MFTGEVPLKISNFFISTWFQQFVILESGENNVPSFYRVKRILECIFVPTNNNTTHSNEYSYFRFGR